MQMETNQPKQGHLKQLVQKRLLMSKSSSKEVRIRVPFLLYTIFGGEPSPQKRNGERSGTWLGDPDVNTGISRRPVPTCWNVTANRDLRQVA